jgi:hypothetical protein
MRTTPKHVPGRWLQGIQHGVVKDTRRSATNRSRSRGSNWSLLNAIQVLRAIQRPLLHAPCQDFRPSNMVLRVSVRRAQINVSKPEFDDIDISILEETKFLAEGGREA